MSFLAPWARVAGGVAALGAVLLHLVARVRPAAYALPTARFIPDRRSLVSRMATRPRDLLLLALRVLTMLLAALAFARPVSLGTRIPLVRIVLLDRSSSVGSMSEAVARARVHVTGAVPTIVVPFDSAAMDSVPIGSLGRLTSATSAASRPGSIAAALVRAQRLAATFDRADSVEVVLVSPVTMDEIDAAVAPVRGSWPARVTIDRITSRTDSGSGPRLERAIAMDDPLGPALAPVPVGGARSLRLVRVAPSRADSAFAIEGGTVLWWHDDDVPSVPSALVAGGEAVIAPFGRIAIDQRGRVAARWSDGTPAARERAIGRGCAREVGVRVPRAGELPLRQSFQRMVRLLAGPCEGSARPARASDSVVARIADAARPRAVQRDRSRGGVPSPIVPWLLGAALGCALLELGIRRLPIHDEVRS
ncbi:MAG: hypothetical protein H0W68_08950 [Gemmatimonadaceae bacterium]|nr:hypothetical protein [Gemmatimonadaceae bacterium]